MFVINVNKCFICINSYSFWWMVELNLSISILFIVGTTTVATTQKKKTTRIFQWNWIQFPWNGSYNRTEQRSTTTPRYNTVQTTGCICALCLISPFMVSSDSIINAIHSSNQGTMSSSILDSSYSMGYFPKFDFMRVAMKSIIFAIPSIYQVWVMCFDCANLIIIIRQNSDFDYLFI